MSVLSILERLAPHVEKEVNLTLNSKKEAQTLKSKLERIHDGLQDAERHGVTDQSVKRWLGELEDVMNEMDDALDEWETMNFVQQMMEQPEIECIFDPWEKVRSLLLFVFSSFKHVVAQRKLTKEMIALSGRLDKILEEKGRYSFISLGRSIHSSLQLEKLETTSSVDKSKAYGRKHDMDRLVDLLLSTRDEQSGALVVSVVGIGGLGKTTLAQLVYNDTRVEEHFGRLKAWVSVPDPFDAWHVAKAIVATFDRSSRGDSTLEILGQRIKAITSGQNFLLVLDNVWTVDRAKWESLKNFLIGEAGFRILVTTRDAVSAKTMGTTHFPRLDFLSDSDCATILNTIALEERKGDEHKEFFEIGIEIAKKCNGLPLAAKTIGHALESRSTIKEWRDFLESPLWMYEDEMSDILRPLRLSYMDLSPLLKRCFLSSVVYPKGFEFDSEGLVRIWTAQGYVDSSGDWKQVLAKGHKYLKTLLDRSFFQVSGRNDEGNLTYKVHDIMHDFATHLSRSEYSIIVDGRTDKRPYRMPSGVKTRYFCARFVSKKDIPLNLLRLLNCARVLCLSDCEFEEFSEDLGKLIHLRYLDLSGNPMKELPASVSNLYNLQTLDLRRCRNLTRFPRGLEKLIKLRHLLISNIVNLLEFHEELRKLSGLWTLDKCSGIRDLSVPSHPHLTGPCYHPMDEEDEAPPTVTDYEDSYRCLNFLTCLPGSVFYQEKMSLTDNSEYFLNGEYEDCHASDDKIVETMCQTEEPAVELVESLSERADIEEESDDDDHHYSKAGLQIAGGEGITASLEWLRLGTCKVKQDGTVELEEVIQEPYPTENFEMEFLPSKYLNNIRSLDINGSQYSNLPHMENLPLLVTLHIQKMDFQALTSSEFFVLNKKTTTAGAFPKLETLTFSECKLWEEWKDLEEAAGIILPCLSYLAITLCPNLKALPHTLLRATTSLQQLFIAGCPRLATAYDREMGDDWDQISHIPNTVILASY